MSDPDADLAELFRDESAQRLDQMDTALLMVESGAAGAETIDSLFRNAHTIKGAAGMLGFDDVRALAHAAEDVLASVREAGVFPPEFAPPLLRATAALRAQINADGTAEPVAALLQDLAACRATLTDGETPPSAPGAAAAATPNPVSPAGAGDGRTLRVPAGKIDHLLDVAGEIMQYRTRLAHSLGGQAGQPEDVAEAFGAGERMLDELRDTAVGMRTLPLAVIAGPLPRMVRDFARAAGKEVEFVVTGADTELDRVILESLSEPLGHLLRNAVIHGVESPAERERAGKPVRGRVELRAASRGSFVEIVVADDGRGASPEVLGEARREGSLADVLARPGYSTAEEVTDLAGRGVGLDAVRSYVHSLGGSLAVRSEPGQGMEVVQLLPVALSLMEVLLFERGGAVYGVPLAVVEQVVTVTRTLTLEGRQALEIGGSSVPVADFAELIGAAAPPLGATPPALIISVDGRQAVVTCDALLGEEVVVVKPLGPLLAGLDGYLGASILGDGAIALLIEPATLTRKSQSVPGLTGPGATDGPAAATRILVVEDSFTVRELQRSILEAAGYSVATAHDGRDALAVLARDAAISLVITDLDMPELDGIGLTRAIRADTARSSLPVVVVTSRADEKDRLRGIEAGADAYMGKRSFDQQALLATVERLVGR
jgi:two-component system chemotaxis sensor kinase CheA